MRHEYLYCVVVVVFCGIGSGPTRQKVVTREQKDQGNELGSDSARFLSVLSTRNPGVDTARLAWEQETGRSRFCNVRQRFCSLKIRHEYNADRPFAAAGDLCRLVV
jgi:hypothetical protein